MITRTELIERAAKRMCLLHGVDPLTIARVPQNSLPKGTVFLVDADGFASVEVWNTLTEEVKQFLYFTESVKGALNDYEAENTDGRAITI